MRRVEVNVQYRMACEADTAELARMRWDFRTEGRPAAPTEERDAFVAACRQFLARGLAEGRWTYWVADGDRQIVSQACLQRIEKIPKPGRLVNIVGYITNVYTRPSYRNHGIGTELMRHLIAWARSQPFEELFLWPSVRSVPFYMRAGFSVAETMELALEPEQ